MKKYTGYLGSTAKARLHAIYADIVRKAKDSLTTKTIELPDIDRSKGVMHICHGYIEFLQREGGWVQTMKQARNSLLRQKGMSSLNTEPLSSHGYNSETNYRGVETRTPVIVCFEKMHEQPFREVMYHNDIVGSDHDGHYCDVHMENTYRGVVAYLGHGRWMPGYEMSDNGEFVWFPTMIQRQDTSQSYCLALYHTGHWSYEAEAVARTADGLASKYAELERDCSERYNNAYAMAEEIALLRKSLQEQYYLRNTKLRKTARERVPVLVSSIRERQQEYDTRYSDMDIDVNL